MKTINLDELKAIIQTWTWETDCEQQYKDTIEGIICYLLPDKDTAKAAGLLRTWINEAREQKYNTDEE